MVASTFIKNAKVMAKGQVTIPKDVREILGVSSGDRVTFVVENGSVRIINSAIYAMQMLQAQMDGEAEVTGITSNDDVMNLVKEVRAESEVSVDPFCSDSNIRYLEDIVRDIKDGKAHFAEHDLIEADK